MVMVMGLACAGDNDVISLRVYEAHQVEMKPTVTVTPEMSKGDLIVVQGREPQSLDPQRVTDSFSRNVLDNVFDTLVYRNEDLSFEPGLALSWRALDNVTWELVVRRGVTFHDGEAFTAEDVKFTLERPLTTPYPLDSIKTRFSIIKQVDVIDRYTVHIITNEPYPMLVARLSEWYILPRNYDRVVEEEGGVHVPIGTGAYQFRVWQQGVKVSLEANPAYWRGRPQIKAVTFLFEPDATKRLQMLLRDEADLVVDLSTRLINAFDRDYTIDVRLVPSTYIQYVALDGTKHPALADERVRKALQYATDVDSIVENVFHYAAKPIAVPLAHDTFGYPTRLEPYGYDLEVARRLLAEAGYPNGFKMRLDAPVGRYPHDEETVQMLVAQWELVGVEVELRLHDWDTQLYLYQTDDGALLAEAHYMGWGTRTFDADDILYSAFAKQPNKSHYNNPAVTNLVTKARRSMAPTERERLYAAALDIIYADVPWIFLFQQYDVYAVNRHLGWRPRHDQRLDVWSMVWEEGV
ncbi:MAG TPA: ABC transporter substrate-binding protein [Anaerolineae bacterium]|nr:ABC transporter substrate-binding protein [Anaerolineae bacterium]